MRYLIGFLSMIAAAQSLHFEKRTLANNLNGGYQVIPCDVNGDGKPDLIALASGMTDLFWFENGTWERHVLAQNLPHLINAACWSDRPNSPPRIAVAYEFSMNAAQSAGIVARLTPGRDVQLPGTSPWTVSEIDRLPTSHRLRWADIDGSGKKVLIDAPLTSASAEAPDYRGHVPLVYYRPGEWKRTVIGEAEEGVVHGIFVLDWDGDGRDEVLIGGFLGIHLYKLLPNGGWSRTEIARGSPEPWPHGGTSDIAAGRLNGERFLAAIEPWHGNEVVVYRSHSGTWRRDVIDSSLLDAHTIATADFDGDGRDEIVAGFRGRPYGIYLYRFDGAKWHRQILDQGDVSAASCSVADLNGDGAPDIACIGQATHNLVLYLNLKTRMKGTN